MKFHTFWILATGVVGIQVTMLKIIKLAYIPIQFREEILFSLLVEILTVSPTTPSKPWFDPQSERIFVRASCPPNSDGELVSLD